MHHYAVSATKTIGQSRHFTTFGWVWMCALVLEHFSSIAVAQEVTDPMEVCFRMTDSGARFACYDHEMQRRHAVATPRPDSALSAPAATAAPTRIPGTSSPTPGTRKPIDDTIGLDGSQLLLKRKSEGLQPEVPRPIVAAIAALKQRPGHLYYFELDNGQVWESTDAEPQLFLGPHETVRIRPGVLGAFFLKTQEGLSVRVHRVR